MMSQYDHVPLSVIAKRLSLVVLLVIGIVLEVVLGLRKKLEPLLSRYFGEQLDALVQMTSLPRDAVATLVALVLWTLAVAVVYFSYYLFLRGRYQRYIAELRKLEQQEGSLLASIHDFHRDALRRWAHDYGGTLNAAIELTSKHVDTLAAHYRQRVRRRLTGGGALGPAERMSELMFAQLPEAAGTLQDQITTKRRSLRHQLWPNPYEMTETVRTARYRDAWQHIELTLNDLHRTDPDPEAAIKFWRTLVVYAVSFPELFGDETVHELEDAYRTMVSRLAQDTSTELKSFSSELTDSLQHLKAQLSSAAPLLQARVELANELIQAESARFQARIIRARERARLEAMAFEI